MDSWEGIAAIGAAPAQDKETEMTIVLGLALVGVVAALFYSLTPRGLTHLDDAAQPPLAGKHPFRIP